ncbi:hypothetical protein D9M68_854730 [compost metagenome]
MQRSYAWRMKPLHSSRKLMPSEDYLQRKRLVSSCSRSRAARSQGSWSNGLSFRTTMPTFRDLMPSFVSCRWSTAISIETFCSTSYPLKRYASPGSRRKRLSTTRPLTIMTMSTSRLTPSSLTRSTIATGSGSSTLMERPRMPSRS